MDADRGDRRWPGWSVLRRARQAARRRPRDHGLGAQPRDDTFGFGVVFSDETLGGIEHADPAIHAAMAGGVRASGTTSTSTSAGQVITSGGHGFAAMSRRRLLEILQAALSRARRHAALRDRGAAASRSSPRSYDLVVAGDGAQLARPGDVRRDASGPRVETRRCRYMWLGTSKVFDAFTFVRARDAVRRDADPRLPVRRDRQHVHHRDARRRVAGARASPSSAPAELAPGESDEKSIARVCELFADVLDGSRRPRQQLAWVSFATVRNETWRHRERRAARRRRPHRALLDRLGHQAGDGGRAGAGRLPARGADRSSEALAAYEHERRPVVLSTQRAAQASLEWFENLGQYVDQEPMQFAFNIMTRSRRVTYDNLRVRDHEFVERVDAWFADHERRRGVAPGDVRPPMFQPFRLRGLDAAQPRDRVRDGHVHGRRRRPRRLPLHPPHRQGARRRRPGDDGDDLRVAGGPDHAGVLRAVRRRADPGVPPDRRLRARADAGRDRAAARSLRPQGLDQADVGGHGRAPPRRQLGGGGPVPARLPARGQPGAARAEPSPTWPRSVSSSSTPPGAASKPASTCSSCTARTATCCRASSPR